MTMSVKLPNVQDRGRVEVCLMKALELEGSLRSGSRGHAWKAPERVVFRCSQARQIFNLHYW